MEEALTRTTVYYCAYGKKYRKSTDLWTSFGWTPEGCTGNGRCNNGMCGQGEVGTKGRFEHKQTIAGKNAKRVKTAKGKGIKQQLWSVPVDLTLEVLAGCRKKRRSQQQTDQTDSQSVQSDSKPPDSKPVQYVIDLFSGGESWREAVESMGMVYIPVDIKTLVAAAC